MVLYPLSLIHHRIIIMQLKYACQSNRILSLKLLEFIIFFVMLDVKYMYNLKTKHVHVILDAPSHQNKYPIYDTVLLFYHIKLE